MGKIVHALTSLTPTLVVVPADVLERFGLALDIVGLSWLVAALWIPDDWLIHVEFLAIS